MRPSAGVCASALLLSLVAARPAAAETIVEGGTAASATWTAAGSPYRVRGRVVLDELTVEAGTLVLVASSSSPPPASQNSIQARSALVINGTAEAPVVFDAESPGSAPTWDRLTASGTVSITHVIVRNAATCLALSGTVSVKAATVEHCSFGVDAQTGNVVLDALVATDNLIGVNDNYCQTLKVSNSVFRANRQYGITSECPFTLDVVNSTFDANRVGVQLSGQAAKSTNTFRNVIVSDSATFGIRNMAAGDNTVSIVGSDLWMNGTDLEGATAGAGTIAADPRYVSATDLHLAPGSPCIDTGTSEGAPDHDGDLRPRPKGAGVDKGAFESDPATGAGGGGGQTGGAGGGDGSAGAGTGGGGPGGGGATGSGGAAAGGASGAGGPGSGGAGGGSSAPGAGGGPGSGGNDGGTGGGRGDAGVSDGGGAGGAAGTPAQLPASGHRGCSCRTDGGRDRGGPLGLGAVLVLLSLGAARRPRSRRRRRRDHGA